MQAVALLDSPNQSIPVMLVGISLYCEYDQNQCPENDRENVLECGSTSFWYLYALKLYSLAQCLVGKGKCWMNRVGAHYDIRHDVAWWLVEAAARPTRLKHARRPTIHHCHCDL